MRSGWALMTPWPPLVTSRLERVMTGRTYSIVTGWKALREAWWPLGVAIAWVLLRSREVVDEFLDRPPGNPVTLRDVSAITAIWKFRHQLKPRFANSDAAERELLLRPGGSKFGGRGSLATVSRGSKRKKRDVLIPLSSVHCRPRTTRLVARRRFVSFQATGKASATLSCEAHS